MISAFFAGIERTAIRYLKNSDYSHILVFYYLIFLVIATIPFVIKSDLTVITNIEWFVLILLAIFGGIIIIIAGIVNCRSKLINS
ncbi:MAG: hypothetical protein ACOCRX_08835 [Candidatus Woesearchaeota archaeon]